MQQSRIYLMVFLLVAVLGAILAFRTMSGDKGGDSAGGDGEPIQIKMVAKPSSDSDEPADDGGEGDRAASADGDGGEGDRASGVSVTLVGQDRDEEGGGASSGRFDGDAEAELPPLAAQGAAEGIHTTMDNSWFPEREAAEWFEPLELDFQASRPLTPERYKEVLGEHHDRIGDVLQRSAEIGDHSSPEDGVLFLEAWNALVDQYKAEAYGS